MDPFPRASDPRSQVVITRFECPNLRTVLRIYMRHKRVKKEVRRVADGYLGGTTAIDWRQRTLLSISLWDSLDSIYAMGEVQRHILAARVPARLRVATSCGIYAYSGEWRRLMFGTPTDAAEPVFATTTEPRALGGQPQ